MLFIRPIETHVRKHTHLTQLSSERDRQRPNHTPNYPRWHAVKANLYVWNYYLTKKKPSSWKQRSFEIKLFSSNTHKDRNQNEVMNALFLFMSNWISRNLFRCLYNERNNQRISDDQKAVINRQQQSVIQWPTVEKCGWTGLPADGEKNYGKPSKTSSELKPNDI